jgi:hypothetical protein
MAFLSQTNMRERGARVLAEQQILGKTARRFVVEATAFDPDTTYDIFCPIAAVTEP